MRKKTKNFGKQRYISGIAAVLVVLALQSVSCAFTPNPTPVKTIIEEATAIAVPTRKPYPTPTPTPTVGAIDTRIAPKDGMMMVYVPAGEFQMGSENENDNESPVHTVYLDSYWIDQTEVTNSMFEGFIDATGYRTDAEKAGESWVFQDSAWDIFIGANWQHPRGPQSSIQGLGDHPVVHISWNDATEYCKWAGRRLPTEAEWEKAASWDPIQNIQRAYPWGAASPEYYLLNFNGFIRSTSAVGTYPAGASPYGVLDMAGNVWEWAADGYDKDFYSTLSTTIAINPTGPETSSFRVLRGGSWSYTSDYVRSAYRFKVRANFTVDDFGFRCAFSE